MRDLSLEERKFLEFLLHLTPQNKKGYFCFVKNRKNYRRGRTLMQLHLNKKLDFWEQVHHKDKDKTNDAIENLEVIDCKDFNFHLSDKHGGRKNKIYRQKIRRALPKEIINKILLVYACQPKKNYSLIARALGISSQTVRHYVKGFIPKFDTQ
jgi:hypothetical protein